MKFSMSEKNKIIMRKPASLMDAYGITAKMQKEIILIAVVTLIIAGLYGFMYCMETSVTQQDLKRPDYSEDERQLSFTVTDQDGKEINTDIIIAPLEYSEENIEQAFDEAVEALDTAMLKDNPDLDNITCDLNLPSYLEWYPFSIQWFCEDYDVVDYNGKVNNAGFSDGGEKEVFLYAVLKYQGWIREKEYKITVKQPDYSDESVREKRLKALIDEAAQTGLNEEYVHLPEEIDGKQVSYEKKPDWNSVLVIILLGFAAVATVILGDKKKKENAANKRAKELKRDYSEMIHKLALLMGAGMTVRMAWEHIVKDYREKLKGKRIQKKYVYEEMTETYYQLNSGVSEINAYTQFGARCDTKEYLKFSSLIVQNLRKGSKEIVKLLELEAIDAFEERKNMAKKYGEEAGTKMLFPMIVMLVVVMGIIMLPAVMAFSV